MLKQLRQPHEAVRCPRRSRPACLLVRASARPPASAAEQLKLILPSSTAAAALLSAAGPAAASGLSGFPQLMQVGAGGASSWHLLGVVAFNVAGLYLASRAVSAWTDSQPVSVVKIQLGLMTNDQAKLQKELRKLQDVAQAGGSQGIWLSLEETIAVLSTRQRDITYASIESELLDSKRDGWSLFQQEALYEAQRADSEEAQGVQHNSAFASRPKRRLGPLRSILGAASGELEACPTDDDVFVVTLLVATRGALIIPTKISGWPDVRHALTQVCGIGNGRILGLEVLWTPDQQGDVLPASRFCQDYPHMVFLADGKRVGDAPRPAAATQP